MKIVSWKTVRLGGLCDVSMGKTPSRSNKNFWDPSKSTNNVWVSIADLTSVQGKEISNSKEYISDLGAKLFKAVPKGTLLASFKLSLGKLAFAGIDLRTNEAIAAFKNDESEVLNEYLYYFLTFFDWDDYAKEDHKVKGKTLNKEKVENIEIHFPTNKNEQERIVKILDEKFGAIEELMRVTQKQIADVKELFESRLNELFDKKNSEVSFLGDHIDFLSGPAFKSGKYTNREDGIRLLRGDNIINKSFRWDGVKKWPKSDLVNFEKYLLSDGDVVLAMDRPFVGYGLKHNLVTKVDLPLLLVQRVARLRPLKEISCDFLMHLIASKKFIDYLLLGQTGVSVPHVSRKQIESYEFYLPVLNDQIQIAKELDKLSEKAKGLEAILQRKIADLDELKKSYLEQAFSGEL